MGVTDLVLSITPHGRLMVSEGSAECAEVPPAVAQRVSRAFASGMAAGLVHLATTELSTSLPAGLAYARDLGRRYLTQLCHTPGLEAAASIQPVAPPPDEELAFLAIQAPPMKGLE